MEHPHRCWPRYWTRDQCVTVAQLCMGHSPLLAAYLHRIGCRDSATCSHYNGADETAEHLVLHCPAHDQARRESWPNLHYQSDRRRLCSFLERIRVVTRSQTGNERERDSENDKIEGQNFHLNSEYDSVYAVTEYSRKITLCLNKHHTS